MKGQWDQDLFIEYRASSGAKKRLLASRLIRENEPLIITLVEQLSGRGQPKKGQKTPASRMSGCTGFGAIEFEDAMQAGRIALAKALDQFDPSKGRISYYLAMKIRYELQKLETFEVHLARVPQGRESERSPVDLVGEARDLDLLASSQPGIVECDVTLEQVAHWQATNTWPESLDAWEASQLPPPPPPPSTLERFLGGLVFRSSARVAQLSLLGRWRHLALRAGGRSDDAPALAALKDREVRPMIVRVDWHHKPVRGFAGVALQSA